MDDPNRRAMQGAAEEIVAADMAAIFGDGVRVPADLPPRPERRRQGGRGRFIAVAALGVLAATVTAGVYAGRDATTVSAVSAAAGSGERPARAARRSPDLVASVATGAPEAALPPALAEVPANRREGDSVPVPETPSLTPLPEAAPAPAFPVPQPSAVPPPAIVRVEPPVATPPPALAERSCEDETDPCFTGRIEQADERLAAAFDRAVAAGVRARTLRGYEREWGRARERSLERPRESLRLYAMITADLRSLADEAAGRSASVR